MSRSQNIIQAWFLAFIVLALIACSKDDISPEAGESLDDLNVKLQLALEPFAISFEDTDFSWEHPLGGTVEFISEDSTYSFSVDELSVSGEGVALPPARYAVSLTNSEEVFNAYLPVSGSLSEISLEKDTTLALRPSVDYGLILIEKASVVGSQEPVFVEERHGSHTFYLDGSETYYYLYVKNATFGQLVLVDANGVVGTREIGVVAQTIYRLRAGNFMVEVEDTIIDSENFLFKVLPGDAPRHLSTQRMTALWDNNISGWPSSVMLTQSAYTPFVPHMITMDLGKEVQLSRLHVWDYPDWDGYLQNLYYFGGAMRRLEVYGSIDYSLNGELDSTWVKLGEYESTKPSGLPEGELTEADIAAGQAGFDYHIGLEVPKVRYIRIRCLENWAGGTYIALGEIDFYEYQ